MVRCRRDERQPHDRASDRAFRAAFQARPGSARPDGDVFESLGVDSMQVLELLSELELEFDVEIPDYELRDVKTFNSWRA